MSWEISSRISWLTRWSLKGSQHLDADVDDRAVGEGLDVVDSLRDDLVREPGVVRHARDRQGRALPQVAVIHLGDRHVEAVLDLLLHAAKNVALALERVYLAKVELHEAERDLNHRRLPGASG